MTQNIPFVFIVLFQLHKHEVHWFRLGEFILLQIRIMTFCEARINYFCRYVDDGRPFWQYIVSFSTGCSDVQYFEELYHYYTTEEVRFFMLEQWFVCILEIIDFIFGPKQGKILQEGSSVVSFFWNASIIFFCI